MQCSRGRTSTYRPKRLKGNGIESTTKRLPDSVGPVESDELLRKGQFVFAKIKVRSEWLRFQNIRQLHRTSSGTSHELRLSLFVWTIRSFRTLYERPPTSTIGL